MRAWQERVAKLGAAAAGRVGCEDFARYCDLHGKGLRGPALAALGQFVDTAVRWPFEARLEFVRWYVEQVAPGQGEPEAPQPLYVRLLRATAVEGLALRPNASEAHLWAGLFGERDRRARLRAALALDPGCRRARRLLVQWVLGGIDYNQHHMPDFYINDPRIDLTDLDEVLSLAGGDDDTPWIADIRAEAADKRTVAETWLAAHPGEGDFAVDHHE